MILGNIHSCNQQQQSLSNCSPTVLLKCKELKDELTIKGHKVGDNWSRERMKVTLANEMRGK